MTARASSGFVRLLTPGALIVAAALSLTTIEAAAACTNGDAACPVVLHMARGAVSITATGVVSGKRPDYYFKFNARAGQTMTVKVVGGNIKTGPGIPIKLPSGKDDAVDENTPYTLPESGDYVIQMHANTMSSGPFGRFHMTLTIK